MYSGKRNTSVGYFSAVASLHGKVAIRLLHLLRYGANLRTNQRQVSNPVLFENKAKQMPIDHWNWRAWICMHPKTSISLISFIPRKITALRLPSPFEILVVFSAVFSTPEPGIKKRTAFFIRPKRVIFITNPSAGRIITDFGRCFLIGWQDLRQEIQTEKRLRIEGSGDQIE